MTLKTDYFDGASGLQTKLNDAFDAGMSFVVDNEETLTEELQLASAAGKTSFTISITTTYQTTYLRLAGLLSKAYLAGITAQLASEDIYSFECVPKLNTATTDVVKIDFVFTFQVA
jgi:hypothetical protein